MKVVTTCHQSGYAQYGHRFHEALGNWPSDCEFHWYTEGDYVPAADRLTTHALADIAALADLKHRYRNYRPPSYLFDVVRFANKVYAAYHALRDHDGIGVWCDADAVMYAPLPADWISEQLGDSYLALFKRRGMYSETGFWIMNCAHPQHRAFLDTWVKWYESGSFKGLANWTDCETLDATVRKFERAGLITTTSLSAGHEDNMHPMAVAPIAAYLDHCKGPRKAAGASPENKHRSTACATSNS